MKSKNVVVHLKSGYSIRGLLEDVDYFLNVKLSNIAATDKNMTSFKRANAIYIRGNLISSIVLEKNNMAKIIKNIKENKPKIEFQVPIPEDEFLGKKRFLKKKFKY